MLSSENSEYSAADNSPRAMPSLYLISRLKMSSTPEMAMKLMSTSIHEILFRLMAGSSNVVKKQDVAMQATPMDTFEAWMLA